VTPGTTLGQPERDTVELPLVAQLAGMGWEHIEGDRYVPEGTERQTFRQVLLGGRLRTAIRDLNTDAAGQPWLDDAQVEQVATELERVGGPGGLVAVNRAVMNLLLKGTTVPGDDGREAPVNFIDFVHPERNDFLAINQFRVDPPGQRPSIIPDVVLFVNGIPLVVVEAKDPAITEPIAEAITQLLRYSNQRDVEIEEGVERLFYFNALMVATDFYEARAASVGAWYEHFKAWKDTAPVDKAEVAAALGVDKLSEQQLLVAGMLRPAHLLDLVRHFAVFDDSEGTLVKKVARYQQFRAVHLALERLRQREGGVIWHTQGSGKSLSMVYLVRAMRSDPELRRFKAVVVTDRHQLEKQLGDTAVLVGEPLDKAKDRAELVTKLQQPGAGLLMAMLQKYLATEDIPLTSEQDPEFTAFPVCNTSDEIVVLVDEAHRGHSSLLHANLVTALPNASRIAFTGTPILTGDLPRTEDLFGKLIDAYTLRMSEEDGSTVPIRYEGREAHFVVQTPEELNAALVEAYPDATPEELEATRRRYSTRGAVLAAPKSIALKAADILEHYVDVVLPAGFKAQLVAVSREAAVRYQAALTEARDRLVAELDADAARLAAIPEEDLAGMDGPEGVRARAFRHLDLIRRLEFAAIISGSHNQLPHLDPWSDARASDLRIARFKKPLTHADPDKADPLAILCVKSMLLTGFDAPEEQVIYMDRPMQGVELLQAIARVNRTARGKTHGLVVDYYGLGDKLSEGLRIYADEGYERDAIPASIEDDLPLLEQQHRAVLATFRDQGKDITDIDSCVEILADARSRGAFVVRLRKFLRTLDGLMPRRQAVRYLGDAKRLGRISAIAGNLYRDGQAKAVIGAGPKVQQLINAHLLAQGIDLRVEPIGILDTRFDEEVASHRSKRTQASEMEQAARYHIDVHFEEDPARYRKLSERLQEILDRWAERWDELAEQLKLFVTEVRAEETAPDGTGLDTRTEAPFWRVLKAHAAEGTDPKILVEPTRGLLDLVRAEISAVDFWRNAHAQAALRSKVVTYLDAGDLVAYDQLDRAADDVMGIAKALHGRLVS
jgi:type I restriction enzyme, R subunit